MTPGNRRVKGLAPDKRLAPSSVNGPQATPTSGWAKAALIVRTVLGVSLAASIAAGLAWTGRRYMTTSPRFGVADIVVVGNERRAKEDIVAESGITLGDNVFTTDLDAVRAKVLADPWLAEVSLARRLPGTVLVQVVERKAAALVALGDTMLVTGDGAPFKKIEPGDPIDLPIITGIRPESLTEDRPGTLRTIRRAMDLAAEYDRGLGRRLPLEEVHVDPAGSFALVVGKAGLELFLGGAPFHRKLEQAARVVAELDVRGAKADAILLDNDARPERVTVRMR
jgi:cell division protein FtsQ